MIKKEWLRRAVRTFIQTAAGYISVNIVTTDLTVKSAVFGLAVCAVSAGVAAIMNLENEA